MFKKTLQSRFLSILNTKRSNPLQNWGHGVGEGYVRTIPDYEVQSLTVEIMSSTPKETFITCPEDPRATLDIKLPIIVMAIRNLEQKFTFEVEILDHMKVRRVFRAGNFWSTTRVKPYLCDMPLRMVDGWNLVQFNLVDFTKQAYGTKYVETLRVQINASCRVRSVYFCDKLYQEREIPPEYKIYLPYPKAPKK